MKTRGVRFALVVRLTAVAVGVTHAAVVRGLSEEVFVGSVIATGDTFHPPCVWTETWDLAVVVTLSGDTGSARFSGTVTSVPLVDGCISRSVPTGFTIPLSVSGSIIEGSRLGLGYLTSIEGARSGTEINATFSALVVNPGASGEQLGSFVLRCGMPLSVPLYEQCAAAWGGDPYDFIPKTICQKGCALSSVAMVLAYHGVTTDPGALNTHLRSRFDDANHNGMRDPTEATYGYTPNGHVMWEEIAAYSKGVLSFKGFSGDKTTIDADLCKGLPVILEEPGHFIVATGKTPTSYSINDSYYPKTDLTAYGDTFLSLRRFGPPGSGSLTVLATEAIQILLTDPLGRRVGYANGTILDEIPDSSYLDEYLTDDTPGGGGDSTDPLHVLFIPHPPEGVYSLRVTGTTSGHGTVYVYPYTDQETPQTLRTIHTDLGTGETDSYILTYSSRLGDLNSDGLVDDTDLQTVLASRGSRLGGPGYNPVADTNNDWAVDDQDVASVFDHLTTQVNAVGALRAWVGLANSDDIGIRFDLEAKIYLNDAAIGSGRLDGVAGGSSGFNNAKLNTIPLSLAVPVPVGAGDSLRVEILVRNACSGSGKNSGRARLWFNDAGANSHFDATIDGTTSDFFLRDGFTLTTTPGSGPRKTIDVQAGAKCSAFKPFGTWSQTLP